MASQPGQDISLRLKVQSALGTLSSGAGAMGIDCRPSAGLSMKFAQAVSRLVRRDGMSVKPRQGTRHVTGSYETDLIADGLDDIIQAALRGTFVAEATKTEADFTSLTISASGATITGASGSFITMGIRKGMMLKLGSMSTAANNGKWFPVLAVGASTITTYAGILTDQGADADCDLIIARQVIQGDPPTERYYTVEQYLQGIDIAAVAQDCKISALTIQQNPNEPASLGFELMGRDMDLLATGSSPTFSSPTFATANPLYLADGGIYVNGTRTVNLSGVRLALASNASILPIIGARLSPDIFLDNAILGGELTGSIEDDTYFNYALNETQVNMVLHFAERESDPADFVTFFFGNLSLGDFSLPFGQSGPMIQTFPIVGGKDEGGATSGYAPTMVMMSTSAT